MTEFLPTSTAHLATALESFWTGRVDVCGFIYFVGRKILNEIDKCASSNELLSVCFEGAM